MNRKNRILFLTFAGLLLSLLLSAGSFFLWWANVTAALDRHDASQKLVVIPKGSGVMAIGEKLVSENLISSAWAFRLMVFKRDLGDKLQAGDFYLSRAMSLDEIAETLTHGTVDIWVTIPEGIRREEIAELLKDEFGKHDLSFDSQTFLEETEELEGFLFPDTYLLPKVAEPDQVARLFRQTFDVKVDQGLLLEAGKLGLTTSEVVTLASLLEREAKLADDRAVVAGILLKRLENDWPLQVDATVQYAVGTVACKGKTDGCDWWPVISDTKFASPYNTYQNLGLPPAPIANPSFGSIKAVLTAKDSDYWYYLSDETGAMHYAQTLEEHQTNIERYLN